MQRELVVASCVAGSPEIVAVSLVDRDQIRDLQDALLDALQVVAGSRQHQHDEEVDHVGHGGL